MLAESGQPESGLDQLARVGFDTLGLQTYLTAGPKEARAWTIEKGWTAPEAAGVIHTDFQRGFIKAEAVSFDERGLDESALEDGVDDPGRLGRGAAKVGIAGGRTAGTVPDGMPYY